MPQLKTATDHLGRSGFIQEINGKSRFILDDPEAVPGADVFFPGTNQKVAGGALGAAFIGASEFPQNIGVRGEAAIDTLAGRTGTRALTEFQEIKELLGPLEQDHPLALALGQSSSAFVLPSSKAVQTLAGIAEGTLADPENPLLGGTIGGIGGFLGGVIGQKLATAVAKRGKGALGTLARQGVPTTKFQRTGGSLDKAIESGLEAIPIISTWARAPVRAQQRALNAGAASVFGFEGKLNRQGLGQIKSGIQKSFQEVQGAIPDQQLPSALVDKLDDVGVLDDATKELMQGFGIVDGEALMSIRSNLNNDMADAFLSANRKEGRRLKVLLAEVDDLITEQMPDALVDQWGVARKQWQFLTAITKGKALTGAGDINLNTMRNNLDKIYPSFRFGAELPGTAQGFGELVQALDELPRALQSSGSAERAVATAVLAGQAKFAPGTLAVPALAAARAAGQPGTAAGGAVGIGTARAIEQEIDEGPVRDAFKDILRQIAEDEANE